MTNYRNIPWAQLSIKGTAIVVSILLAFWIDAWWNIRQGQDAERHYLTAIMADIDRIVEEVDRTTAADEALNRSARERIAAWERDSLLDESVLVSMLSESWASYRLRANLDTYTDLLSSGGVMPLQDPQVRSALAKLRANLDFELFLFQSVVDLGLGLGPLLKESIQAGNISLIVCLENDMVSARETHNNRKSDVLQSVNDAQEAILSATPSIAELP